jgi:DNA-binding transcriptional regulator LsrR (DeoR family)
MSKIRPTRTEVQKVAALYCEGMSLPAIGSLLAKEEAEVSLLIEAAEQMGYISYQPTLTVDTLDPEVNDLVRNEALTAVLSEAIGQCLETLMISIAIVPSPWEMFTSFEIDVAEARTAVDEYLQAEGISARVAAVRAAKEISNCLFDGQDHVVGLNWGYLVSETIGHIRPLPSQIGWGTTTVVSLFGDLDFRLPGQEPGLVPSRDLNCNNLVARLAQRLAGHGEAVPLNVPGFVPSHIATNQETFEALRSFMTSHSTYRMIFGGEPPEDPGSPREVSGISNRPVEAKIAKMDTIITGFGAADRKTVLRNYQRSLLDEDEIETLLRYFAQGKVVGDIGGHFVCSPEGRDSPRVLEFVEGLNRRLLAAQPSDFVDVASRHRKHQRGGGVVGVTVGARKARILYALLSMNPCPISRLIIDTHCALALLSLLDSAALEAFVDAAGDRQTRRHRDWSRGTRELIRLDSRE